MQHLIAVIVDTFTRLSALGDQPSMPLMQARRRRGGRRRRRGRR